METKLPLLNCTADEPLPPREDDWHIVAVAPPDQVLSESQLAPARDAFKGNPDAAVGIVPLAERFGIAWNRLPRRIAALANPAFTAAVVLLHVDKLGAAANGGTLAEILAQCAEDDIVILPDCGGERPSVSLPSLAPRRARTAQAVHAACRGFELSATASDRVEQSALRAGLLQINDDLDASHRFSQSIEGEGRHQNGDYWHAIMHRREPDDSNSKYWFRRVGTHPIFGELEEIAREVLSQSTSGDVGAWTRKLCGEGWNAMAFVDLCSIARQSPGSALDTAARELQWFEMMLLLEQTIQDLQGS